MNTKDKNTADIKKKKKTSNVSVKNNHQNVLSSTYSYYLPKSDTEKTDKPKTARNLKNDTSIKNLKQDKSSKTITNTINRPHSNSDNLTRPKQTNISKTRENQDILAGLEIKYGVRENMDPNNLTKRWSDIPARPYESMLGSHNSNSYISSRQKLENVIQLNDETKQARHQRNNSHTKIQNPYSVVENLRNNYANLNAKTSIIRNNQPKPAKSISKEGLNNTNTSFLSQEAIIEENPNDHKHSSKVSTETFGKSKINQKSPDYFETEHVLSVKTTNQRNAEKMNIEEVHTQTAKINLRVEDSSKEIIKIIEETSGQIVNEIKTNIPTTYSSLPPSNHNNTHGYTPNYNSNPTFSGSSSNGQNSSHKSQTNVQENAFKKSSGKSTNPMNSNNSSYIKAKGRKSNKTESTCISGEDSPSPVLDCDEIINQNFGTTSSNKVENNCFWVEKFDSDPKSIEISETTGKRGVLRDITDAIMTVDTSEPKLEEELANFNPDNSSCAIDSDTINYLVMREIDYAPDAHYFDKKQTQVTWIMRGILIDWMMEVCMEFTLKRETFHYAVNYVDRYLSTVLNIQKWELQLVGVTAMYIASKVEEIYAPKVSDFAKSADNGYTTQQIMDMEMKMLKALKWLLNPPTLNTWANWYLTQWDLYIENSPYAQNHPLILESCEGLINFKQPNEKAYARFREIMQIIDCAVLDIQTLQYKSRTLVAAFMYLTIGKHFKQFTVEQIYEEFPNSSLYLLDQEYAFNDLFGDFLVYSFGFQLVDLLPSIQYASTFFKLPLNFDLPTAAKINKENVLEGHFEEFLAYQTHHPMNVDYTRKRPRNVL